MPHLETFFEFGGSVELLTTDTTLAKYDIIMSEIMWGVDKGFRDKVGHINVQDVNEDGSLKYDAEGEPIHVQLHMSRYSYPRKFSGLNSTIPQTARDNSRSLSALYAFRKPYRAGDSSL